ncbi:MAG: CheR family methyltransferase [Methylobacter sp.]
MDEIKIQDIEIGLFLEALFQRHGYDFRNYAKASLKRRVMALAAAQGRTVAELIPLLLREDDYLAEVIAQLSVPVSDMFRDPPVFKTLRETVLPLLQTYPRIKVWQAGCATGEEVYSLAIMLDEEGLLERTQIYATDINDIALRKAEDGIFPVRSLGEYENSYKKSGGKSEFSDYYVANANFFRIDKRLRQKIVFAHHNLVSDGVFCEVQLILCRNVLIYFNDELQQRVLELFHNSLVRGGFLCLGTRESLRSIEERHLFAAHQAEHMIFHKNGIIG